MLQNQTGLKLELNTPIRQIFPRTWKRGLIALKSKMADDDDTALGKEDNKDDLKPEDIPGATVEDEGIGKLTVNQLKFWLKCRRLRQKGSKKELIERVRNLNQMDEIREKVYDPDPDKAYTKAKHEKLKMESHQSREAEDLARTPSFEFPHIDDSNYTTKFSVLPSFLPTDCLEHLKNCGKPVKKNTESDALVEMASAKGLRLMNFVHDVQVYKPEDSDIIYLRALCWASYKKSVKYKVKMVINTKEDPKIKSAKCDKICPAGKSGCCCHVMAVIWKLDEITRNKGTINTSLDDRACTSKPRKWGIPGKRTVDHKPVMEKTLFKPRHQSDIPGKKRRGVLPTFFDPRPAKSRKLDPNNLEKLRDEVKEINADIPFSKMIPNADEITLVNTVAGLVAKGSVLHLQLKDYDATMDENEINISTLEGSSSQSTESESFSQSYSQSHDSESLNQCNRHLNSCENDNQSNKLYPIISPPKHHPVSLDDIKQRCEKIKRRLSVDDGEIQRIESETRGQSACSKWFEHRFGRVTASKCHRIACKHRVDTSPTKIVKDILNYNTHFQSNAMKDGLKNEHLALSMYEGKMNETENSGFKVELCGFYVSKDDGTVGASPDGLVTDPSSENPHGIVEIKNIIVKEGESLLQRLQKQSICDKSGDLRTSHKYYYQIQHQMYVVNRPWCDFVVRGSNGDLFIKRVHFDPVWWNDTFSRLKSFYDLHVLPELAYPRVRDGLTHFSLLENSRIQ